MRIGRWIGIVGAIVFAVGFVLASSVPGGGGVDDADFEKFYVTDDNTVLPIIGVVLLSLGLIAVLWFFYELRSALIGDELLAGFAWIATALGLALVAAGACILAGPSGAQAFGDAEFVGVPVAHALAQAGFATMLVPGALLLGAGVVVFAFANRRALMFPRWVSILGYVAGALQLAAIVWIPFFAIPLWVVIAAAAMRRSVAAPAADQSSQPLHTGA
jgi:hypothetical protein